MGTIREIRSTLVRELWGKTGNQQSEGKKKKKRKSIKQKAQKGGDNGCTSVIQCTIVGNNTDVNRTDKYECVRVT